MNLLLLSVLVICSIGNAQEQKFKAGVLFGLNTSQITGDDLAGYDKPGLTFGGFVKREFGRSSITMELAYLGKGSRKNVGPKDSIPTFYKLQLHYVEIPILYQFKFKFEPKLQAEIGPSIGVLLSFKEEDLYGDLSGEYASTEQFKRTDVSFNIGASWLFSKKWALNIRNANSIFPVRDYDQKSHYRLNKGQYSSSIMGRIIYQF
jgi:hypothetical protein